MYIKNTVKYFEPKTTTTANIEGTLLMFTCSLLIIMMMTVDVVDSRWEDSYNRNSFVILKF